MARHNPPIGQFCFGNAWGKYDCPEWVSDTLYAFSKFLAGNDDDMHTYGHEYVGSLFEMHPYSWAGCTCGAEDTESTHAEDCLKLRPNFLWKGEGPLQGLRIYWYKYIYREVTSSLSLRGKQAELAEVIRQCQEEVEADGSRLPVVP